MKVAAGEGRAEDTFQHQALAGSETNAKSCPWAAVVCFPCGWVYAKAAGLTAEPLWEIHPDLLLGAGQTAKIMSRIICYT